MVNAAKIEQLPNVAWEEIERVARAIVQAHGFEPDQMLQFDPYQVVDPPTMLRKPQERWRFMVTEATNHIAAFNAIMAGRTRRVS